MLPNDGCSREEPLARWRFMTIVRAHQITRAYPQSLSDPMKFAIVLLTAALAASAGRAAAPEVDYPLQPPGEPSRLQSNIPVGKTLLIPVNARDADGDPLTYKVTSSSAKIMV